MYVTCKSEIRIIKKVSYKDINRKSGTQISQRVKAWTHIVRRKRWYTHHTKEQDGKHTSHEGRVGQVHITKRKSGTCTHHRGKVRHAHVTGGNGTCTCHGGKWDMHMS